MGGPSVTRPPHTNDSGSEQPTFVTDHLALGSYLLSKGHQPSLQATRSGVVLFTFEQTTQLTADAAAFNNGTALVEPSAYDGARITLRRRMDALREDWR